ncbi:hypothetical protein BD309DRAFT_751744 [Dichomitus squalens]|nr:hypothetical protein BD309DRAFT_751744 [Dichomitus squalens]
MSLVLPWEVLERIVDYAYDDSVLLRSFSLTCRQLRPRTLLFMMERCHFNAKDQVFAFCDFLRTRSEFTSLVQSLFVCPIEFPPYPPIRMLPNISTLRFIIRRFGEYARPADRPVVHLHPSTLSCYRMYGERIRTLSLDHLSFTTYSDFPRLVLAFPKATEIVCQDILAKLPATSALAIDVVKRKLSKRPQLETITIYSGVDEVVTSLLLDGARCTVQTLMWTGRLDVILLAFLMPSEWKRLHPLTIQSELGRGAADDIERLTRLLANFRPPSLEDVSAHFLVTENSILHRSNEGVEDTDWTGVCSKLEEALSTFR